MVAGLPLWCWRGPVPRWRRHLDQRWGWSLGIVDSLLESAFPLGALVAFLARVQSLRGRGEERARARASSLGWDRTFRLQAGRKCRGRGTRKERCSSPPEDRAESFSEEAFEETRAQVDARCQARYSEGNDRSQVDERGLERGRELRY